MPTRITRFHEDKGHGRLWDIKPQPDGTIPCPFVPGHSLPEEEFHQHLQDCWEWCVLYSASHPYARIAAEFQLCPHERPHWIFWDEAEAHMRICLPRRPGLTYDDWDRDWEPREYIPLHLLPPDFLAAEFLPSDELDEHGLPRVARVYVPLTRRHVHRYARQQPRLAQLRETQNPKFSSRKDRTSRCPWFTQVWHQNRFSPADP